MSKGTDIQLFEGFKVRSLWDAEQEKWYISIVDVIEVLTESANPRKYWSVLKTRLKQEGSELTTNCSQLKLQSSDGKKYLTDVADVEQLSRLIQSIPSPKAEPFKLWLSQSQEIAKQGGKIAGNTRKEIEDKTGKKIISPLNAKNQYLKQRVQPFANFYNPRRCRRAELINDFQPFTKPRWQAESPTYFSPMATPRGMGKYKSINRQ